VDDAYLLMGDARFFKGDFYSAIEVYEYVISNFKNSPAAHQAEINLLITYLQLNKNEDAEALYTKLKTNKTFSKQLLYQLDIAGAAVNIRQEKYLIAIKLLENALPHFKNKASKIVFINESVL
jgi:tetratricopeptide (TPR) repeat protein